MSRIPFRRPTSERRDRRRWLASEAGQTLSEYTVVLAAIAVACVVAIVLIAAAIGGLFDSADTPSGGGGPFVPPQTPQLSYPTKLADCEHGRWRNFAQFRSEDECRQYVEEHTP